MLMKTIDNEIGVHDNGRTFLLNTLHPYTRTPVSGWIIAQVFEKFRICVRNLKVHYHAHKSPLLDPILMSFEVY